MEDHASAKRKFTFRPSYFPESQYCRFFSILKVYSLDGTKAVNSVNLDLLRAMATHHPDGRPKDPHAHHQAEAEALIRQRHRDRWLQRLARLSRVFRRYNVEPAKPCADHPA
jgi:hypothetical protein